MIAATEMRRVEMRGVHADLFEDTCDALVEGPLDTGKSFAGYTLGHSYAERFPGSRGIICRKKRVSMTQSSLVTWESVLGRGHPAIHGTAGRANRNNYLYPNGSEVVVAGMNNPQNLLSAEYDWCIADELVEFTREDVELIGGRLRNSPNSGMPFSRFVGMTNPRGRYHWVNIAADNGLFKRYLSRHWMNPSLYDMERKDWSKHGKEYYARIYGTHTGARFDQYVLGKWSDETGVVYPMFDKTIHIVDAEIINENGRISVKILVAGSRSDPYAVYRTVDIQWTAAGVDWGFTNPGAMVVVGFDSDGVGYVLAEVYKTGETVNWWADRAVEMRKEFNVTRFVCDSANPGDIVIFNDYLGTPGGREEARLAVKCEKGAGSVMTRIRHLQTLLEPRHSSPTNPNGSRIYILKDSLRLGRDKVQDGKGKPCCLAEELPYIPWVENVDERALKEAPDKAFHDHAENALAYLMRWVWKKDLAPKPESTPIMPGTLAHVLGHRKKLEAIARHRRT